MIVLDASASLDLLLTGNGSESIAATIAAVPVVHAPHLIDVEILHALRRHVRLGSLSALRAGQALEDLAEMPLVRHEHRILLPRAWALRDRLSAYDATYVALAEQLEACLITSDRRLAHGASGLVELIVPG